jgi:cell division protein FtsL
MFKMNDVMKIANSPAMWVACGIAVILVIIQAVLFATKSYRAGKKIGLSESQMKKAVKSSAITSIGPSIVILSGMLSLLITVGGPMAWMRLSLIGSVMFESIAAGFGTAQVGVQLGADQMTELAFTMAVWTMILGSIGWVLFATFSANRMEKVQKKISGGDTKLLIAISTAAIIGAFSALSSQHLVKMNKNSIACILGAVIMAILLTIANKKNIQWMKEWALTISILGGMIITALL